MSRKYSEFENSETRTRRSAYQSVLFSLYAEFFYFFIVLLVKENTFGNIHWLLIATIIVFVLFLCSMLTIRGESITPTVPTQSINFDLVEPSTPHDLVLSNVESPLLL